MTFIRYLASGSCAVDVWDADSQLQMGVAQLDLRQLLRQGRECSETMLEVDVLDHRDASPDEAQRNSLRRAALHAQGGTAGPAGLAAPPPVALICTVPVPPEGFSEMPLPAWSWVTPPDPPPPVAPLAAMRYQKLLP